MRQIKQEYKQENEMKKEEFFNIGLPKWPAMVVKGEKVTEEQAAEIIVRTDGFYFSSNDHEFSRDLYQLFYGVKPYEGMNIHHASLYDYFKKDGEIDWNELDAVDKKTRERYGIIDLEYLNNSRIVSSWTGGPHGWCNWNGYIGCNNYNIGKYPDVETVYEEWLKIAKEFDFLNLTCQLYSGEGCEEDIKPVIEFRVKDGKVKMSIPKKPIDYVNHDTEQYVTSLFSPNRERGCTIDKLKSVLPIVEEKLKMKED